MNDGPLTHRQRSLIRSLAATSAERARREAELRERRNAVATRAAEAYEAAAAEAEERASMELAAAERAHRERLRRSAATYDEQLAAARRRMDAELLAHDNRTDTLESRAVKNHQEACWLADTIVESGEAKIRLDLDVARKAVKTGLSQLDQIRDSAAALLAQHRHGPLPAVAAGPSADDNAGAEALDAAFAASHERASELLWTLESRVRPAWAGVGVLLGGTLLGAVAGALAGWFLVTPQPPALAIGAAVGAAILLGALLTARRLARRRVPAAAEELARSLAAARRTAERRLAAAEAEGAHQTALLVERRRREVQAADERLAAAMQEVRQRREKEYPALVGDHESAIADLVARRDGERARLESEHAALTAQIDARRAEAINTAAKHRDEQLSAVAASEASELAELENLWTTAVTQARAEAVALTAAAGEACPEWSDPAWDAYAPSAAAPAAISLGRLSVSLASLPGGPPIHTRLAVPGPDAIDLPIALEVAGYGSLLLRAGPDGREAALDVLRNAMLRILTTFPPGKARFTLLDPVGLGRSFAGFMHLADHDEGLVGSRIWTDSRHIEQRLSDLTEHMETVIQKYLRNEFADIAEYNAQAGEVAEPYRFLVIADFPANLTEPAARRLASILESGPRCGVYTLIAADAGARVEDWIPMAALRRASLTLEWRDGRFVWDDPDFSPWPVRPDAAPDEARLTAILNEVGRAAKDVGRVRVPFEVIAPPEDRLWSLDTTERVSIPLGRAGARKLQHMVLGEGTAQHALIAGRTGSGKSTLLHVLITNLALWYSPDEVELYLVDFKKGVEFKTYAAHAVPHARVVAVESEREFGLSVLRKLDAELTRRGSLFREAGVQDVAAYRRSPAARDAAPLPRILLIVDEFQEFFVEDDRLAQDASLLLDRLVRQGRAFGIHIVLGSQTLGGAYGIARSTMGQMGVRIALQCSESDSYLILSEDNAAARLLSRPGEAIYNDASGLVEGNSPFQIVWLPEEKREASLRQVQHLAADRGRHDPPPIVFEGNIPAELSRNHLLAGLLDGAPPAPAPRAWLGDAISIKDPTAATFRRQSGSNLLIVGHQDDAALATMLSTLLSLAAHHIAERALGNGGAGAPASFVILDGTPADSRYAGLLASVAEDFPLPVRLAGVRDAGAAVSDLAAALERREAPDAPPEPPVYLLINGLHRMRDLRKSDDFGFSMDEDQAASPGAQLAKILREGPPLGVHTVAWCDSAANVDRALDRASLREFDARVLFQMGATDSTHLVDTPAAASLGRGRALLHQEEHGTLEKFRPYAMPGSDWLAGAIARLRSRLGSHTPTP